MIARFGFVALGVLALTSCGQEKPIRVIGSSTVFPFSRAVAAAFADAKKGPAPSVEETGTVTGFAQFCATGGGDAPAIADASRRMTKAEFQKCKANGVGEIMEIPIGLDGIAVAESTAGTNLSLTAKDLYLALAANPKGKPNAAKTWKDVNPALPALPIKVIGPPPSSGTRDMFETLVLQPGCVAAVPEAKALEASGDLAALIATCRTLRTDGPYAQGGENDDRIVGALEKDAGTIGVFGYSFLEKNAARLRGLTIDGVAPTATTIASGEYPATRTLYLYVKAKQYKDKAAVRDFVNLYTTMWGPGGPLVKQGLIAMSDRARDRALVKIQNGEALDPSSLQ